MMWGIWEICFWSLHTMAWAHPPSRESQKC
jgi:hypothetical protein